MPAYLQTAYKCAPDPYGETHQACMEYNKTELLWTRHLRFHLRDYDNFKPSSEVWRGAGATAATHGAGERTCLQSSFLMSCENYNAKLLLFAKTTELRKTINITQNQNLKELRKTTKYSKTMKLYKHNGITHINNS